jgi:hypothetical protein
LGFCFRLKGIADPDFIAQTQKFYVCSRFSIMSSLASGLTGAAFVASRERFFMDLEDSFIRDNVAAFWRVLHTSVLDPVSLRAAIVGRAPIWNDHALARRPPVLPSPSLPLLLGLHLSVACFHFCASGNSLEAVFRRPPGVLSLTAHALVGHPPSLEIITDLLAHGVDLNGSRESAIRIGDVEICSLLFVDSDCCHPKSPLWLAIKSQSSAMVQRVLEISKRKELPFLVDRHRTPLHIALCTRYLAIISLLLHGPKQLSFADDHTGQTWLCTSVHRSAAPNPVLVGVIFGLEIDCRTAFHWAVVGALVHRSAAGDCRWAVRLLPSVATARRRQELRRRLRQSDL